MSIDKHLHVEKLLRKAIRKNLRSLDIKDKIKDVIQLSDSEKLEIIGILNTNKYVLEQIHKDFAKEVFKLYENK